MNAQEQRFLDAAVHVRKLVADGGLRKVGLGQPTYLPGERLLVRVPQATARRVPLDADRAAIADGAVLDGLGKLKTTGTFYVTDRRAVLMGNWRKQLGEWSWHELTEVSIIRDFAGVRFVRPDDVDGSDAALHVYRKYVTVDPSVLSVALRLVQVEAAYVLGVGRDFDAWLANLPARWN